MITFLDEENNTLSQKSYDLCIFNIQFHQLNCSCGHAGCLHIHGYYTRKVKATTESFRLKICRVKCSVCGKTHAILPSSIVPYSQLQLVCCCQIISDLNNGHNINSVCDCYVDVDENNVKSVIRRYTKYWKERLFSERISLAPIKSLILQCFLHYSMQFLQVHRTVNLLFAKTT